LLINREDAPGIRYLSKEALDKINKNPDYFSGGVIDNKEPLSLPPGFVLGEHPRQPGQMILHFDQALEKTMHLAQLEQKKDPAFACMDNYYFADNPSVERLWSLENRKVISSTIKQNETVISKLFDKQGKFQDSSNNFDYYNNDPAAQQIFKEKISSLTKNIDKAVLLKARN
jgi:hypothetical protein